MLVLGYMLVLDMNTLCKIPTHRSIRELSQPFNNCLTSIDISNFRIEGEM